MSFIITRKVTQKKVLSNLGINPLTDNASEIDVGMDDENVELTYTASQVVNIFADNNQASVAFTITTEGATKTGNYTYTFTYSGEGNPFVEAEEKLQAELEQEENLSTS